MRDLLRRLPSITKLPDFPLVTARMARPRLASEQRKSVGDGINDTIRGLDVLLLGNKRPNKVQVCLSQTGNLDLTTHPVRRLPPSFFIPRALTPAARLLIVCSSYAVNSPRSIWAKPSCTPRRRAATLSLSR